jgi:hypothetical protein
MKGGVSGGSHRREGYNNLLLYLPFRGNFSSLLGMGRREKGQKSYKLGTLFKTFSRNGY